jgi:hypothetical protein
MRKLLLALLVAGILGGAVYGAAASFTLTTTNLGADDSVVAACGDLSISYAVAWDATDNRYEVTSVTVTDPAPVTCDGASISVQLTDGGASAGSAGPTAMALGTTGAMPVAGSGAAADVDDVHVASVGP